MIYLKSFKMMKVAFPEIVSVAEIGDYPERQGITSKPILKEEILSVQVLHSLLRCFDHFMKIVTYVKAGVYNWLASEHS